jgi:hypothetical protein
LEITVRNKVLARIFPLVTSFLTVIPGYPGGTYHIARNSTGILFSNNYFSKNVVLQISLEITVRDKVPRENILAGILFLTVITRGT